MTTQPADLPDGVDEAADLDHTIRVNPPAPHEAALRASDPGTGPDLDHTVRVPSPHAAAASSAQQPSETEDLDHTINVAAIPAGAFRSPSRAQRAQPPQQPEAAHPTQAGHASVPAPESVPVTGPPVVLPRPNTASTPPRSAPASSSRAASTPAPLIPPASAHLPPAQSFPTASASASHSGAASLASGAAAGAASSPAPARAPGIAQDALRPEQARWVQQLFQACGDAVSEVIQGKRRVIDLVFASALAGGHVLLEDVPGTGKTALARSLAEVIQGTASRIQFTPDLLPGDVTGISVYDQRAGVFEFHAGPVFANVVLADEINRASPKTQSALLEVMEESRVTIDGVSHDVGSPFLVIATQNPIEQAGTYRLPEAQLDRFMIKTAIGYPDASAMLRILQQHRGGQEKLTAVVTTAMVAQAQEFVNRVHVSPLVADYAVRLVEATRRASEVRLGASVRGALALVRMASAWAAAHGRHYVTPDDVRDLAMPALAHRLVLEPEAEFDGVTAEQVVGQVLLDIRMPQENGTA